MKIPTNKQELMVVLRDYDNRTDKEVLEGKHVRSTKSRMEIIAIVKKIKEEKKINYRYKNNTIEVILNDSEMSQLNGLFNRYIFGVMPEKYSPAMIIETYRINKNKPDEDPEYSADGKTIAQIARELDCVDEVVRKKVKKLVDQHVLIRIPNPENKREGLYYILNNIIASEVIAKAKTEE